MTDPHAFRDAYHHRACLERPTCMQLLLTILTTAAAAVIVVLAPGACLLATWRLDRVVPPPLVPAAALALGLVPLAAITSATLLLHQPIEAVAVAMAALVLAGWWHLARRTRDERHDSTPGSRGRARTRARDWLVPLRDFVAGDWLRGTPTPALVLAVAGGLIATFVGFHAWNDSLYHIGQAQKLLALDAPSFSNTLQFTDGSAHPGYLVPLWHEAVALTSFVARVDPVVAAWILPGVTLTVSVLAFGGLGWSLVRARHATSVASAAVLVTTIGMLPSAEGIMNGLHPGIIALGVLAPLVLAMLFTALWPEPWRDRDDVGPRMTTRAATFVAVIGTAEIGLLHVGYLWVLGMGILGYFLVWALRALRAPWSRQVVMRHLSVGAAIAIVAVAVLALLFPGLNRLEGLGRDAQAELEFNDSEEYAGENAANLDAVLRGDPAGAFHLRNDYLVLAGGLALLGLLSIPLAFLAPRWPGGWYLVGAATLVLGIAMSDVIFPRFVEIVTLDQARRIERVLPLTMGLTVGALAASVGALALWRRGGALRAVAVVSTIGVAAVGAVVVDAVPRLAGYGGERIVHPRVLVAVLVILLVGLVVTTFTSRGASWTWPTDLLDTRTCTLALVLVLVAATPVYGRIGDVAQEGRLENVPLDMRTAEMRLFAPNVARELRKLPPGSTVLSDPRSRNPYIAMAIAPVYVVSSVPRHTALTPENRVTERFRTAMSFFDRYMTYAERRQLLLDEQVDAVVLHPLAARWAQDHLERMPGVRMGLSGKNQRIWLVDRTKLDADRESGTSR